MILRYNPLDVVESMSDELVLHVQSRYIILHSRVPT